MQQNFCETALLSRKKGFPVENLINACTLSSPQHFFALSLHTKSAVVASKPLFSYQFHMYRVTVTHTRINNMPPAINQDAGADAFPLLYWRH